VIFNHPKVSSRCLILYLCLLFFLLQVQKHLISLQSTPSQHHLHLYEWGSISHLAFNSFGDPSDALSLAQGDNPRGWQQQQRWGPVAAPALFFWFARGRRGLLQWGLILVWQITMNNAYECGFMWKGYLRSVTW